MTDVEQILVLLLYASFSGLAMSGGLSTTPSTACNSSVVMACENGKPGIHYEKSLDPCNFYEYWGNCLKFLEANCRGDKYYEERVYSHQFDGVYYCPWLFPGDQPVPGCDKRKMLQCKLRVGEEKNNYGAEDCSYRERYKACLETFRDTCSDYHLYHRELSSWKYITYIDCPRLLGCNMTLYKSCWNKLELGKVNIYDLNSFKNLCGKDLNETMTCLLDQRDRCEYTMDSAVMDTKWEFQMTVYSCYGVPECNLALLHQCAIDHYSENLWMMTVPTPKQAKAVCRNYKSYMQCVAPYKESCIQNKERLQDIGTESLSSVVKRMETLYQYVSLLCEDHYEDIIQYGSDCFDTSLANAGLFSCEADRHPIKDYAPDQQRCISLQNQTSCIRNILSGTGSCVDKSVEVALAFATSFENFLLTLHHKFTCEGSVPVKISTRAPTSTRPTTGGLFPDDDGSFTTPSVSQSSTLASQNDVSKSARARCGYLVSLAVLLLTFNFFYI